MSLASFLLGGAKASSKTRAIDKDLDAVFQTQIQEDGPSTATLTGQPNPEKKKRRSKKHEEEPDNKRSKPSPSEATQSPSTSHDDKKTRRSTGKKHVTIAPEPESGHESPTAVDVEDSTNVPADESADEEDGPPTLVHETLRKDGASSKKRKTGGRKEKYVPTDETEEKRNARTIFIGNLSPEVAQKRPLQKQLHRHILSLVPAAKIESTRYRSVAFQTPTSKLPSEHEDGKNNKTTRQHDRDRASSWRDTKTAEDPATTDEKKFLTPSQKKKIAFINHDLHSSADSVHAYIVFAYPQPAESRPANLPPPPPVMDPIEATRLAVEKANGTMFLNRMLRVDYVTRITLAGVSSDAAPTSAVGDPKLTIFVGNLDFASKEEDLRVFFEGVVSAERGPPSAELSQDGEKLEFWVTRVRMIRDKDTQLGKGFAYVQFADRTCVDEILALDQGKLKFAKRKLRVQRCKTTPGASAVKGTSPVKTPQATGRTPVPVVPKGDPSLGEKLASLSKEERKQAKAADADRLARRMAKKKARIALAKQGVSVQGKERERVRKTGLAKKAGAAPPKKASKGRVRSEKSIAKRNLKK